MLIYTNMDVGCCCSIHIADNTERFYCLLHVYYNNNNRQIAEVAQQRVQQSISNDLKVAEVRQEGEEKVLRMAHQLNEEQNKSRQGEEQIKKLRRYIHVLGPYNTVSKYKLHTQLEWL